MVSSAMPMSATATRPQCARPGRRRCPGLRRAKVTVRIARDRGPAHRPRVAVDAGGHVDGEDRASGGVHALDRARAPRRRDRAPGPLRTGRRRSSVDIGGADTGDGRRPSPVQSPAARAASPSGAPGSQKREDDACPAPADAAPRRNRRRRCCRDRTATRTRPRVPSHLRRRLGDRLAGAQHELIAGRPGRDGAGRRPRRISPVVSSRCIDSSAAKTGLVEGGRKRWLFVQHLLSF